jgi:serine/threonine-protein kinase
MVAGLGEPTTTVQPDEGDDPLEVWPFVTAGAAEEDLPVDPTVVVDRDEVVAPLPAPLPTAVADEPAYVTPDPPLARRSWRRWAVIALVLLLLVSVGVSAGALVADLTATPTHEIPAVKGLDVDAAREKLASNQWRIVEERTRRDGTDPGEVLDVVPEVGTSLREGERVTLVVSDGPSIADVPTDLAGRPVEEATRLLERAGFEVSTEEQFDEDVDAGRVIGVAEGTKASLPKGETVGLVVSRGPEPRTLPGDLPGRSKDEVLAILGQLRLEPKVREAFSSDVDKGVVIGTDPGAGAKVERGGEVVVVVSKGPPLVEVPNVRGADSVQEAVGLLREAGLRPGDVSGDADGRPFRTDPPAGTMVPEGSTVDLILRGRGDD